MRSSLVPLVAALALLVGATLTATGAVPSLGGGDAVHEDVVLRPATGPGTNGEYARFEADGDLTLDLGPGNPALDGQGVAGDSVTTIADVFTVTYDGNRTATVWLTDDSEAVTFLVDGETFESEAAAVTLGPNESVAVGLRVDTTGRASASAETMTVHARLATPDEYGETGGEDGAAPAATGGDATAGSDDSPPASGGLSNPRVTVDYADGVYRADVANARPGRAVSLDFGRGDGNVRLESLRFVPRVRGSYDLTARESDDDDFATGGLPDDRRALGYVRLDHAWRDDDVDEVTVSVSVRRSWLSARGVSPDEVTLYRHEDGDWRALPTRVDGVAGDRVLFSASSPGLSVFGVAGTAPTAGTPGAADPSSTAAPSPAPREDASGPVTAAPPAEPGGFDLLPIALVALALAVSLVALRRFQSEQ